MEIGRNPHCLQSKQLNLKVESLFISINTNQLKHVVESRIDYSITIKIMKQKETKSILI